LINLRRTSETCNCYIILGE